MRRLWELNWPCSDITLRAEALKLSISALQVTSLLAKTRLTVYRRCQVLRLIKSETAWLGDYRYSCPCFLNFLLNFWTKIENRYRWRPGFYIEDWFWLSFSSSGYENFRRIEPDNFWIYRQKSEHVFNFEKLLEDSDVFVIPEKGAGETRELLEKSDIDYAGRVKWDLALKDPIYTQKAE